jgi:sec-independent protein translocase protein TatA
VPNIGGPELIFLLVIVLIVFGAGKLPDVFGQIGKGVRSFRDEASTDKPDAAPSTTATATDQKKTN